MKRESKNGLEISWEKNGVYMKVEKRCLREVSLGIRNKVIG